MVKSKEKKKEIRKAHIGKGPRLYVKAIFTGFRRNKVWTLNNQALLKLEGVNDKKETQYYLGKRVVYIYKTKSCFKTIWGRIRSHHGNNGVVIAKFLHNLPPRGIGAQLRVMLYPQRK
jgi:large subunit ribosomal protein L35Ae